MHEKSRKSRGTVPFIFLALHILKPLLQLITDLTEQNQRLTQELREVGETERELRDQIQRQENRQARPTNRVWKNKQEIARPGLNI
jgi:hypothetical protein